MKIEIPVWTTHHNQLLYSLSFYAKVTKLKLRITLNKEIHVNGAILFVEQKVVFFDYSDDKKLIASPQDYDAYFKRSLSPLDYTSFNNLFPLNFQVNFSYKPFHLISQMDLSIFFKKGSLIELLRASDALGLFTNESHGSVNFKKFTSGKDSCGKVIFMTRLWDPDRNDDPEEKERRRKQNLFRANACRIIKKSFPDSIVGLYPDEFAIKTANDVLLDIKDVRKKRYFKTLANCDIGVADDGLKDTPGWKIGEYTLFGKAIISTPLTIQLEDFKEGMNYLSTGTRDNFSVLPDLIHQLRKNEFYKEIQQNNKKWCNQFLEPMAYVTRILSLL